MTPYGFWKLFGVILTVAAFGDGVALLWHKDTDGIVSSTDMGHYTKEWRLKQIKNFLPDIYNDGYLKDVGDWCQFSNELEDFNKNWKKRVSA